jgi:hypothetical protein
MLRKERMDIDALLSSIGIVGLEPVHLSSAGRVSPKSM